MKKNIKIVLSILIVCVVITSSYYGYKYYIEQKNMKEMIKQLDNFVINYDDKLVIGNVVELTDENIQIKSDENKSDIKTFPVSDATKYYALVEGSLMESPMDKIEKQQLVIIYIDDMGYVNKLEQLQ